MAVSFNLIPSNLLVPGVNMEFDTSLAQQGPALQPHVSLLVGQRLSSGTKAADTLTRITSASQARSFYGAGSMLAAMAAAYLNENKINELWAYALDDDGAGVKAAGSVQLGGSSIGAGTLGFYVAGRRYTVGVAEGDTPTAIVAALVAEIQADADRQVDAAVNGVDATIMDLTYRHAGEVGNAIDVRQDETLDDIANLTVSITGFSGGSGNPDLSGLITAMGEVQYHEIAAPYIDATSLSTIETELEDRWGPLRQNDGQYISAFRDTLSNWLTFGDGRNNEHETIMPMTGPYGPHEWAANLAAVVARDIQADPARQLTGVELRSVSSPAPDSSELWLFSEAQQLLAEGLSTFRVVAGTVIIERLRTTRKEDNLGSPDSSLADLNPKTTLSYIRYDLRVRFFQKFAQSKLADDGTRFAPGQDIVTPSIARAELIAIFTEWENIGLVENVSQFKRDLVVERNGGDPNRLDVRFPPDLINQLRVTALKNQFLL